MRWLAMIAVPAFVATVLIVGLIRRVSVFDEFCTGAREGVKTAVSVLPSLVALITAVSMLRASGFTEWLAELLRPVTERVGFPAEALPAALLRPLSGSGSLAALRQVLVDYGTESRAGLVASVLQSSTETTFYTLTVYFGAVGVKRSGWAFPAAAVGDLTGMILAALTVKMFLL